MNLRNSKHIVLCLVQFLFAVMVLAGCSSNNNASSRSTPAGLTGGAQQGKTLSLNGTVSELAGRSLYIPDGFGNLALFNYPEDVATDGINLYIADTQDHTIRKLVIATGEVTTLAGSTLSSGVVDGTGSDARFFAPFGITTDGTNLYVVDSMVIRKIEVATGKVTTLAGHGGLPAISDGTGSAASFNSPTSITTNGTNLYVADSCTIRKVVIATGEVTTLAGSAVTSGTADGIGPAARFSLPRGITNDGINLYVTDSYNYTIRKVVIATGEVTTLAGKAGLSGTTDGTASAARFSNLKGITTDGTNLYATDGNTIRKVAIATGEVTTLAGSVGANGSTDGLGLAAQFDDPCGLTTDGTNLYVADSINCTIRKVVINTGEVTTFAGGSESSGTSDGTGSSAQFNAPSGVTTDGKNLFVADLGNHTVRKLEIATGVVTTLAGSAGVNGSADGLGATAKFDSPCGLTTDGTNLYVTDTFYHTIRKIVIATGEVTTLAGNPGSLIFVYPGGSAMKYSGGSADGTGSAAQFNAPSGVTTDGINLYVADFNNHTIRKVEIATGVVTTLAGSAGKSGSSDGIGTTARFSFPRGITTDGVNLYVTDLYDYTIRKVSLATGKVTTLAGSAGISGSTDGTGNAARFNGPSGITTDGTNLYVVDTNNNTIRKVVIATGEVTTLTGNTGSSHSELFGSPTDITTDGIKLYVTNTSANTLISIK